jgi:hypothetical protein
MRERGNTRGAKKGGIMRRETKEDEGGGEIARGLRGDMKREIET